MKGLGKDNNVPPLLPRYLFLFLVLRNSDEGTHTINTRCEGGKEGVICFASFLSPSAGKKEIKGGWRGKCAKARKEGVIAIVIASRPQ